MGKIATEIRTRAFHILVFLVLPTLFACAGGVPGWPVDKEDRILFTQNPSGEGVFESGQLQIDYRYVRQGDTLHLSGHVRYARNVDALNVYVPILDASGQTLKQYIVYYSGYRVSHWLGRSTFDEQLELPPNAAGFSFTYTADPAYMKR